MKSKLNEKISDLLAKYGPVNVLKAIQEEAEHDQNTPLTSAAQEAMDRYRQRYKRQIDALQEANYTRPYSPSKGKSRA